MQMPIVGQACTTKFFDPHNLLQINYVSGFKRWSVFRRMAIVMPVPRNFRHICCQPPKARSTETRGRRRGQAARAIAPSSQGGTPGGAAPPKLKPKEKAHCPVSKGDSLDWHERCIFEPNSGVIDAGRSGCPGALLRDADPFTAQHCS